MPWGDLTKAAVVCAASVGKSMNFAIRVVRREMGSNMVRKLTKRAAKVAKLEFFRKGYTILLAYAGKTIMRTCPSKQSGHVSTNSETHPKLLEVAIPLIREHLLAHGSYELRKLCLLRHL